jgi:hypothetical protein
MAAFLGEILGFLKLDGESLEKRYDKYKARYKVALDRKKRNGERLSGDEVGRMTFAKKLDNMCPHFERTHELFGDSANVEPPTTVNLGFGDDLIHHPVHGEDDD